MNEQQVDILIIGGGLTGAALMLALEGQGFATLLVDAHSFTDKVSRDFDARTLALSPASVRILQQLDLWPLLTHEATPIHSIHVSEQGRFGRACLDNMTVRELGFVIEMQHVSRAMYQRIDHKKLLVPGRLTALDSVRGIATIQKADRELTVRAKLVVAADGAESTVRCLSGLDVTIKDYSQHAIIANIGLNRAHGNCAYERFTRSGPLAMLPMTDNRAALVWALQPLDAARMMALDDRDFLKHLQQAFGYRLGRFNKIGKRNIYPLRQVIMPRQIAWPLVFIGNAVHTLHPVAGQGFNLGLRDAASLAQCILEYGLDADMLEEYQSMRRYDQISITRFTDGLVNVFTSRIPGLGLLRSLGLMAMDASPVLQKILTHHAGGFAGNVPDLVCGIDLPDGGDYARDV